MSPAARLYVILTLIVAAVLPTQRAGGALLLPRYNVADVGTLGGTESDARGINSHGDVVGSALTGATNHFGVPIRHAFMWSGGTLLDLGLLFGESAEANAINDWEQIVGTEGVEYDPVAGIEGQAFIWEIQDGIRYLADVGSANCRYSSEALGINNRGEVVGGWGACGDDFYTATFWKGQPGSGKLPSAADAIAVAINDHHEIVGSAGIGIVSQGQIWKPKTRGALLRVPGVDLSHFEEDFYSAGYGINQHGWVVGSAYQKATDGSALERASIWTASRFQYLPILPTFNQSRATAINNGGAVVGTLAVEAANQPPTLEHACLWINGQAVVDLNDRIPPGSGWVLQEAAGINDAGQIVGTGLHNGIRRGFVLTPQ